jgi:hypothetical protein
MYLRGGTEAQGRPLIVLNSWNTFCNNASEGEPLVPLSDHLLTSCFYIISVTLLFTCQPLALYKHSRPGGLFAFPVLCIIKSLSLCSLHFRQFP